jgi:hypothetical protein
MRVRKTSSALAALAVGGALVLGGCGDGDSSTEAETGKATTPASQASNGAMKREDDAMKDDSGAMHGKDAMKQDDSKEP